MARCSLGGILAVAFFAATVSFAAEPGADFSGTWALDKSRSEGLPQGMDQSMTVKQSGDRVEIVTKLSGEKGAADIPDEYVLDGKETEFTPPAMGHDAPGKGKRTSKWTDDHAGFDVAEEATVEGQDGPATLKVSRHWQLAPDGKTLTIDMSYAGPMGAMKTKRVFTKQ